MKITIIENGPAILEDDKPIEIISNGKSSYKVVDNKTDKSNLYLCRCEKSKNQPFCDGSHKQNNKNQ